MDEGVRKGNAVELCLNVDIETAADALKILNWFFDMNPDHYLIQKPRTVYDSEGRQKTTVRYQIKQKEAAKKEGESSQNESIGHSEEDRISGRNDHRTDSEGGNAGQESESDPSDAGHAGRNG